MDKSQYFNETTRSLRIKSSFIYSDDPLLSKLLQTLTSFITSLPPTSPLLLTSLSLLPPSQSLPEYLASLLIHTYNIHEKLFGRGFLLLNALKLNNIELINTIQYHFQSQSYSSLNTKSTKYLHKIPSKLWFSDNKKSLHLLLNSIVNAMQTTPEIFQMFDEIEHSDEFPVHVVIENGNISQHVNSMKSVYAFIEKHAHFHTLCEFFVELKSKLESAGYIKSKRVFLSKALNRTLITQLKGFLMKMNSGIVVKSVKEATHIVYPDGEGTKSEDTIGNEYCRVVESEEESGRLSKVHWWYYPDSYDSWIAKEDVTGEADEGGNGNGDEKGKVWHVGARWIVDSVGYNEWMNEFDYELELEERLKVDGHYEEYIGSVLDEMEKEERNNKSKKMSGKKIEKEEDDEESVVRTKKRARSLSGTKGRPSPRWKKLKVEEEQEEEEDEEQEESGDSHENVLKNDELEKVEEKVLEKAPKSETAVRDDDDEVRVGSSGTKPPPVPNPLQSVEQPLLLPSQGESLKPKHPSIQELNTVPNPSESEYRRVRNISQYSDKSVTKNETVILSASQAASEQHGNEYVTLGDILESLPNEPIKLPSYSTWFSLDRINDIEKRGIPEFFSGRYPSKTSRTYKHYRDFMVDTYRSNPKRYLSATAVRRHLAGDVTSILRIHAFLEHWGIINYGIDAELKSMNSGGNNVNGNVALLIDSNGNLDRNAAGIVPKVVLFDDEGVVKSKNMKDKNDKVEYASRSEMYAASLGVKYWCDSCGKECSKVRFHCGSVSQMDLCSECYANGLFPSSIQSRDFIQMTIHSSNSESSFAVWTESETLLLLEALELFGEDWESVAEHVGTKSKEACVMHFVRLPIEDTYLVNEGINSIGDHHNDDKNPIPFGDATNPVMVQVAMLASMVSPEVAAAAAEAAMNKFVEMKREKSGEFGNAESVVGSEIGKVAEEQVVNERHVVEAAAGVALAAAGIRAKELAEIEEREMDRYFTLVVETKLKTLELKLKHLEKLESNVKLENDRMRKSKLKMIEERIRNAMESREKEEKLEREKIKVDLFGANLEVVHIGEGTAEQNERKRIKEEEEKRVKMEQEMDKNTREAVGAQDGHKNEPVAAAASAAASAGAAVTSAGTEQHPETPGGKGEHHGMEE